MPTNMNFTVMTAVCFGGVFMFCFDFIIDDTREYKETRKYYMVGR